MVRPLFTHEPSMIRWTALRGALLYLDMVATTDQDWAGVAELMGLHVTSGPNGQPDVTLPPHLSNLPEQVQQNIMGLFWSITRRWGTYEQIAQMNIAAVNGDPDLARVNDAVALDYIAWTAVAMHRTGQMNSGIIQGMPEPGRLEQPGYYIDPLFAKAERYWDGHDWTAQCRVRDGRSWSYVEQALR